MDRVWEVEVLQPLARYRGGDPAIDHLHIALVAQRVDEFLDEQRVPLRLCLDETRQTLRKIGHPKPVSSQPTRRVSRDPLKPE